MKFSLQGSCAAPHTPFNAKGDLDVSKIPQCVDHLVKYGNDNLYAIGSMGEGLSMTTEERKQLAAAWMTHGRGKFQKIIIHVGSVNLRETAELAAHAESIGADGIAAVAPFYYKPKNEEALVSYFKQVAAAAPRTPLYYYDIDFMTGVRLNNPRFLQLADAELPTLAGMKHTTADLASVHKCVLHANGRYDILLGSDRLYLPALTLGCRVQTTVGFHGHVMHRLIAAHDAGDLKQARQIANMLHKAWDVFEKYDIFASTKAVTRMLGADVGGCREPIAQLSTAAEAQLKAELDAFGYFDFIQQH